MRGGLRNFGSSSRLWGATLAVLWGCEQPKPPLAYELLLRAESDAAGLPGVRFFREDKELGVSDASGKAVVAVFGQEGSSVQLSAECPRGYKSPASAILATLRRETRRPEFKVDCFATTRKVVIAVRATGGADLPVMHLGEPVGRTDAWGVAHVLLEVPAFESVQVALDTSARPKLKPHNPSANFSVGNRDQLFVFDAQFAEDKPKAPKVVAVTSAAPSGPVRLEAH